MPEPVEPQPAANRHQAMILAAQRQVQEARFRAESSDSGSRRSDGGEARSPLEGAADLVEGYRLDGEVHRGGQGVVYRGVQLSTGRTVAVKLLPLGAFASRNDRMRFEREVQVLSQLEAPGIVRIVDSGVAAGHWWFTMDYIDGVPLDEFVRFRLYEPVAGADLNDEARTRLLSMFADVAEAVHAAHLHGVIHRDLKPRNILVDQGGHVHVLDFGLAKLDGERADESGVRTMTQTGQFVGSLPWASPEQAAGETAAVDLRTDVYSLGVILYQLLTGQFPYRVVGSARDVVQNILTVEPSAPSGLSRSVDDELQTILLKCLSKDADRRYQSAGELARDLRRYLAGEPIEAKRDSLAYFVRKKLKRHRVAAAVAAAFVLLVAAGSVTSIVLWQAAVRQRDRAIEAEHTQELLRVRAETEYQKAVQADAFLQRVIGMADPRVAQGRELTVREMMQTAVLQLDAGQLAKQPEIEAAARATIGQVFLSLGRFDDAAAQAERALAIRQQLLCVNHRDVAQSMVQLSEIRSHQGRADECVQLAQQALKIDRIVFQGRDDEEVVKCLQRLAWAYAKQSHISEGAQQLALAVAMLERLWGPDDVRTIQGRVDQTIMSHDIAGSEQILRRAIETFRAQLGPRHPDVFSSLNMLGGLLQMKGDLDGALACFREALELTEAIYGRTHPLYVEGLLNLARLAARRDGPAAATALLVDSLPVASQAYGEQTYGLAQYYIVLGGFQWQSGDASAEGSFANGLAILHALGRDQSGEASKARVALCQCLIQRGELAEAQQFADECLAVDEQSVPRDHWTRAQASSLLGWIRMKQGAFDEAELLMLAGCYGLEQQVGSGRELHRDAIHRLNDLYDAWNAATPDPATHDKADHWRRQREALPGPPR